MSSAAYSRSPRPSREWGPQVSTPVQRVKLGPQPHVTPPPAATLCGLRTIGPPWLLERGNATNHAPHWAASTHKIPLKDPGAASHFLGRQHASGSPNGPRASSMQMACLFPSIFPAPDPPPTTNPNPELPVCTLAPSHPRLRLGPPVASHLSSPNSALRESGKPATFHPSLIIPKPHDPFLLNPKRISVRFWTRPG